MKVLIVAIIVTTSGLSTTAATATPRYRGPCHTAIDRHWPPHLRARAHYVVNRESRGIPSAANRSSSARGCFQMLLRYSAPFYRQVGCTNAMWANATCNVRAALALHRVAGWAPWRVR